MRVKANYDSKSDVENLIQPTHITQHFKDIIHDTLLLLNFLRQIERYVEVRIQQIVNGCLFEFVIKVQVVEYLRLVKAEKIENAVFKCDSVLIEKVVIGFVLTHIRANSSHKPYIGCLFNWIIGIHDLLHVDKVV